ncbi:S1 family peptidase [Peterkaempfera bronchialis]|uniref:S1 family peptidase n=1 Tax=Peterkaempfera bronchialis TaxID=2126346 RepID=A0A345T4H4_9ACTN|nr:S1 family peptidase [Peterkaempfera bronchialis]AXI80879.1 S1 family peptidase [Peterkaempfera bronchialis]
MRRTTRLRWGLAALLALGTGTLGLAPASAVPAAGTAAPQLPSALVAAVQRDLGGTAAEATARLRDEAAASTLAPRAQRAAGAAYGGSWFDAEQGTLVVAVTDPGAANAVRTTGATPVRVTHTLATLDGAKAALDKRAGTASGAPSAIRSWRVDPRTNRVVAEVQAGAADRPDVAAFLASARSAGLLTVHEESTPEPRTYSAGVVGGDPYYINGNTRCSIGFAVVGGFVSAGHCGTPGSSVAGWDGSWMGTFAGSTFPGRDYSYITIGNGWWTVPVVLGWGTVSDALVRGSWEAPIGSSVCRSGSTTHWHCGTVLTKNETVNYSQGAVYGLTGTSVCAEPGDSGGSFITGDQAQGVTSGGWGNCSSGGQTWFQPVNEILSRYGLRLVTSG